MAAIDRFPGLRRVAVEIAYDNGLINRFCPEATWLESLDPILGAEGVYEADLQRWSDWLQTLTDDQIWTVAAGEHSEIEGLMVLAPPPECGEGTLDGLLNDIFEGVDET